MSTHAPTRAHLWVIEILLARRNSVDPVVFPIPMADRPRCSCSSVTPFVTGELPSASSDPCVDEGSLLLCCAVDLGRDVATCGGGSVTDESSKVFVTRSYGAGSRETTPARCTGIGGDSSTAVPAVGAPGGTAVRSRMVR